MDGRKVEGFRVTDNGMEKEVWIDAETGDLVRIEGEFANARGMKEVLSDFRFDVDLDDSLFSVEPPEGYTVVNVQADPSKPDEQDLISFLREMALCHTDKQFLPTLNIVDCLRIIQKKWPRPGR